MKLFPDAQEFWHILGLNLNNLFSACMQFQKAKHGIPISAEDGDF